MVNKHFVFVCFVFHGATPIPYVQLAILNLPNPYFRSTTVLLDTNKQCLRAFVPSSAGKGSSVAEQQLITMLTMKVNYCFHDIYVSTTHLFHDMYLLLTLQPFSGSAIPFFTSTKSLTSFGKLALHALIEKTFC